MFIVRGRVRETGAYLYERIAETYVNNARTIGQEWTRENALTYCGMGQLIGWKFCRIYPDSPAIHTIHEIGGVHRKNYKAKREEAEYRFDMISAGIGLGNTVVAYEIYAIGNPDNNFEYEWKRYHGR